MDLFESEKSVRLTREEAAARLRALADEIAGNNALELDESGRRVTVRVADEVEFSLEVEVEDDERSIEIELTW